MIFTLVHSDGRKSVRDFPEARLAQLHQYNSGKEDIVTILDQDGNKVPDWDTPGVGVPA